MRFRLHLFETRFYMNQEEQNQLGIKPVGKLLFSLALPAISAQIVNLLYNIVDRIYIGHLPEIGNDALTGVGVTFSIITLISAFAALIGFGGAPRAAIALGKKDNAQAETILGNCVSAIILLAVVLTVIFRLFAKPMLYAFGASDVTIGYALSYLQIYVLGTIFVMITIGLNAFITSQGFAKTGMQTVMIGAGINIVLDPILIYGFHLGVRGAAIATVLSQAASAIWVICFLMGKKSILKIRKRNLKIQFGVIGPVMALGVSPFVMQATESVLSVCFNTSLLKYGGNVAVGAMTILASVMQSAMMPVQGLTQGMQPIVSYNYGAEKPERVRKAFKLTMTVCLIYTFSLWLVAMCFPELLARIFTKDEELIAYAAWAMRIYMGAAGIFGAQLVCQQTFVSLGKAVHSLFLAVLRKLILLIPFIYILPCFLEDKVFAVFLAEPVSDFLAVCTTVILFRCTVWKYINTKSKD